jgi:hypothetical protein
MHIAGSGADDATDILPDNPAFVIRNPAFVIRYPAGYRISMPNIMPDIRYRHMGCFSLNKSRKKKNCTEIIF